MRCFGCCTAESYQLPILLKRVSQDYRATQYRDVVHIEVPTEQGEGVLFCFSYGCVVAWDLGAELEKHFLSLIKCCENNPLPSQEIDVDVLNYTYGETARFKQGELVIPNKETLTLLAFSHGLAQSVKLATFEQRIHATYGAMKHIPQELAKWGKISLNRQQLRKKIGALFLERSYINLHLEVLSTPDFFWEYPDLESFYMLISTELDINVRVEVLNQRLDVMHELFYMLNQEQNHQHSSRLELTIIILIVIEVVLVLFKDIL